MEEGSEERKRARKEEIEYKFDREGGGKWEQWREKRREATKVRSLHQKKILVKDTDSEQRREWKRVERERSTEPNWGVERDFQKYIHLRVELGCL